MIRNHMIDPESTPPRPTGYNNNAYETDDPWFTQSPQPSPTAANVAPPQQQSNAFNYNQFGYNPYPSNNYNSNVNPASNSSFQYEPNFSEDYENEPPLLEELGIRFDHILAKTQAVLYLHKVTSHLSTYIYRIAYLSMLFISPIAIK